MRAFYKVWEKGEERAGRAGKREPVGAVRKTNPPTPNPTPSQGGFLPDMTRREAAQILGVREAAPPDRVRAAHRKLMIANHPDAGGSPYLAAKVNEAKEMLTGKGKGRAGSAF